MWFFKSGWYIAWYIYQFGERGWNHDWFFKYANWSVQNNKVTEKYYLKKIDNSIDKSEEQKKKTFAAQLNVIKKLRTLLKKMSWLISLQKET